MAALEYIHTYSLVHDDIPATANDLVRRGMPTTHAKYGHAIGVLAGDGLLNYAYEVASNALTKDNYEYTIEALKVISSKPGIQGMLGGQVIDVLNSGNEIDIGLLKKIHKLKTAALIQIAMMVGAILAGATKEEVKSIEEVALNIGLAFQIQDDVLDVISTDDELGKPVLSDEKNKKTTYVSIYGVEEAKKLVEEHTVRAIDTLKSLDGDNEFLVHYIEMLITRKK
jgi:geranylgeranyl diphosphate synthase type II